MSAPPRRPCVGILETDQDAAATLIEWVQAAGFTPQRVQDLKGPMAAFLVRWPATIDLANAAGPIVLLADRKSPPSHEVAAKAVEVVALPDVSDVRSLLAWSSQLSAVLKQIAAPKAELCRVPDVPVDTTELRRPAPALVAVGVSTGGPVALEELFASLRGVSLPPMVLVQHIPTNFLVPLVERLRRETGYRIEVARDGGALAAGVAYFAPGEHHLRVVGDRIAMRAKLSDEAPLRGHRPAAEILFQSCAELPLRGVGVIMTGMGQDGAQALLALRQRGWATIGQSEATCAIYGMPRAAKAAGAVEREVALADIGTWLAMLCKPRKIVPV